LRGKKNNTYGRKKAFFFLAVREIGKRKDKTYRKKKKEGRSYIPFDVFHKKEKKRLHAFTLQGKKRNWQRPRFKRRGSREQRGRGK